MGNRFASCEADVLRLAAHGLTTRQIAVQIGRTTKTVSQWLAAANAQAHVVNRTPTAPRICDRADYPDLVAAMARAESGHAAIGRIAARFRLPYDVVRGLVGMA